MNQELNFQEITDLWQSQSTKNTRESEPINNLQKEINAIRSKMLKSNILGTVGLLVASIVISYVLVNFERPNLIFYLSIIAILTVIILVGGIIWTRIPFKGNEKAVDTVQFIQKQIRKLERSYWLIKLSPIYGLVLGILVNVYFVSITDDWEFVFYASNVTWVYIFGVTIISYIYKMKKYNKEVKPIVEELKDILAELS